MHLQTSKYEREPNKADGISGSPCEVLISNRVIEPVFNRLKMIFPKSEWQISEAESARLQLAEHALHCTLISTLPLSNTLQRLLLVPLLFLLRTAKLLSNSNYRRRGTKTNKKERFIFLKIRSEAAFNGMSMDQIGYFYFITSKHDKYLQLEKNYEYKMWTFTIRILIVKYVFTTNL